MKPKNPMEQLEKTVGPGELRRELIKDARINIRVTKANKASMVEMASKCGLTLTEYLVCLHNLAVEKLGEDSGC